MRKTSSSFASFLSFPSTFCVTGMKLSRISDVRFRNVGNSDVLLYSIWHFLDEEPSQAKSAQSPWAESPSCVLQE